MDIASVKKKSKGGSKFWLLVVDNCTRMKWSKFLKRKSDLSSAMTNLIDEIEDQAGHKIKILRCNNAAKNLIFQRSSIENRKGVKFKFTATQTPQQNGVVERAF